MILLEPEEAQRVVNRGWVLSWLHAVIEDPLTDSRTRLSAIKMAGDYLKMFVQHKNVTFDLNTIARQLPEGELKVIAGEVMRGELVGEDGEVMREVVEDGPDQ